MRTRTVAIVGLALAVMTGAAGAQEVKSVADILRGPGATASLAAPNLPRRWAEAVGLHLLNTAAGHRGVGPESVEMLDAVITGKMGMNQGWFHPSQSRFGWGWLAGRMDVDRDGRVSREEFRGPADFFNRLDRDQDGALTAADFDWYSPAAQQKAARPKPAAEKSGPVKTGDEKAGAEKKEVKGGGGPSLEILLAGLFNGEVGSPYEGPRVGRPAPRFTLPTHDGTRSITLADYLGEKPVVLIFGSFT